MQQKCLRPTDGKGRDEDDASATKDPLQHGFEFRLGVKGRVDPVTVGRFRHENVGPLEIGGGLHQGIIIATQIAGEVHGGSRHPEVQLGRTEDMTGMDECRGHFRSEGLFHIEVHCPESRQGMVRVFRCVQGLRVQVFRPGLTPGVLGLFLEKVRTVGKQERTQFRRAEAAHHFTPEAVLEEGRNVTGMVEMGVGEEDQIDRVGRNRKIRTIAQPEFFVSLKQTTIDEDAAACGFDQVARTGDRPRCPQKSQTVLRPNHDYSLERDDVMTVRQPFEGGGLFPQGTKGATTGERHSHRTPQLEGFIVRKRIVMVIGIVIGVVLIGVATVGILVNTVFREDNTGGSVDAGGARQGGMPGGESGTRVDPGTLPSLDSFATSKTDVMPIDLSHVRAVAPYLGQDSPMPHQGMHFNFSDDGTFATNLDPTAYPAVYAVADGIVTTVDTSKNLGENDRYGVGLTIAQSDGNPVELTYSLEPFIPEPGPGFYAQFLTVTVGQVVKAGDVLGYLYIPPGSLQGTHLHFDLNANGAKYPPAIFSHAAMELMHAKFGEPGGIIDGQILPPCAGYMVSAREDPFGQGAQECMN